MSTGNKKKKKSKTTAGGGFPFVPFLAGLLIVALLGVGSYLVLGKRKAVVGYDESVKQVNEVLRTRDPESVQGAVKLSEIETLVTGSPTVTRESENGEDFAVYTWSGGISPVGFRLKLEKNGSVEEVVELKTLGLK